MQWVPWPLHLHSTSSQENKEFIFFFLSWVFHLQTSITTRALLWETKPQNLLSELHEDLSSISRHTSISSKSKPDIKAKSASTSSAPTTSEINHTTPSPELKTTTKRSRQNNTRCIFKSDSFFSSRTSPAKILISYTAAFEIPTQPNALQPPPPFINPPAIPIISCPEPVPHVPFPPFSFPLQPPAFPDNPPSKKTFPWLDCMLSSTCHSQTITCSSSMLFFSFSVFNILPLLIDTSLGVVIAGGIRRLVLHGVYYKLLVWVENKIL